MPVTMAPLPGERPEQRRGPADQRGQLPCHVFAPGTSTQIAAQPGTPGQHRADRSDRIVGRDDLTGADQDRLRAGRSREIRGRQVQPGQGRPGRPGVPQGPERRPGHRIPVQVEAHGDVVHLIDVAAVAHG